MKRIYKNNDLAFNLTINNFPINKNLINSIEFRFYTLNNNNYISKSETDVDVYNQVILQWDELKKLEEGVLYYDYTVSLNNDDMVDGTQDTVTKKMTNYYIVTGIDNINIDNNNGGGNNVDLSNYYTKNEVNNKLEGYVEDDVLGSYYTKNEVNELIDNFDSTQYYTKTEVDSMIPTDYITSIPSEYITETELTAKGYLTEHQSLDGYAKLTDIPTDYIKTIPSEYITETELSTSLNGYSTTSHTHSEYITEQYDDTALANRVSALETELNGVSQQITELNNMVV